MAGIEDGSRQNREINGGINRVRAFLTSLSAAGILIASGCAEAKETAKTPTNTSEAKNEMVLAKAEKAKAFATLSADVQKHIRAEFDECMADVEDLATGVAGDDKTIYQIVFDDGADDCDSIRNSLIRTAVADKGIDDITKSITSG